MFFIDSISSCVEYSSCLKTPFAGAKRCRPVKPIMLRMSPASRGVTAHVWRPLTRLPEILVNYTTLQGKDARTVYNETHISSRRGCQRMLTDIVPGPGTEASGRGRTGSGEVATGAQRLIRSSGCSERPPPLVNSPNSFSTPPYRESSRYSNIPSGMS